MRLLPICQTPAGIGNYGLVQLLGFILAFVKRHGSMVFFVEALNETIAKYGKPQFMNSDQISQFTGLEWTQA